MITIGHLKKAFLNRITRISRGYDEAQIVFDHYLEESLKLKTRVSRATSNAAENASYDVHDRMSIKSCSRRPPPKAVSQSCFLFSEALLELTEGSTKKFVSFLNCTKVNSPHSISEDVWALDGPGI